MSSSPTTIIDNIQDFVTEKHTSFTYLSIKLASGEKIEVYNNDLLVES